MGGSKASSSTTTVKRLPDFAQGHAREYVNDSQKLSLEAYKGYTGDTIAPQAANEIAALTAMANRGRGGDPVINEAVLAMELILNGSFLPGTRQAFIDMWSSVQSAFATERAALTGLLAGDTLYYVGAPVVENRGAAAMTAYGTKVMERLERRLYRENYKVERDVQSASAGYAVQIGKQGIADAEILRASGLYQREYDQAVLHDLYRIWLDDQEGAITRLEILGNSIRTMVGTQMARTKPQYRPDKTAAVAGGALSGAAAGASMSTTAGPWGIVIGAVVGGVLGYASSE
jgi:hypothetical protein